MRKTCGFKKFGGQRIWNFICILLLAPLFAVAVNPPNEGVTAEETLSQPERRISGTVLDADGNTLPGVNVRVQGTNIGTNTDADGRFTLSVPANAMLDITYIGYVKQTVKAADNIRITLEESSQMLDEVVVVGYGTVKKSDLTGAVASVAPKSFIDQPASGGISVLAGRAPGVVVRRANGAPGEGSTLRIRGVNSILGSNDPLVVVDGNYGGIPNMYDIESIEILKDASATAIYGSRGANGVIIVTTKRGANTGNHVKYYSDVSFAHNPRNRWYDMMEPREYAEFTNQLYQARGNNPPYTLSEITGPGTNWQEEIFRTGVSQNHKVVLTGGNDKMKYYISPSFNQVDGVIINTWAKSYGLNAKFDAKLNERISYQIEAGIGHGDTYNPDLGRGTSHEFMTLCAALVWSPIPSVYNPDGSFVERDPISSLVLNPVALTTIKDTRWSNSGSAVGNVNIKIIDGLTFDGKASISTSTSGTRYFRPGIFYSGTANARQNSGESRSWLVNAVLTYNKTLAEKNNLTVMAGFEETKSESRSFEANANDLSIHAVEFDDLSLGRTISMGSGFSNSALRSYFARAAYNYDQRYYFTGTFRADGSSKFQGKNRFSYFPSFGVSWRLSEEGFLKDTGIFQNLKLRGTWGIIGSQAVGAYATYSTMSGSNYTWGTNTLYRGYGPGAPVNPNLQWEETTTRDFGLDITTLNSRLSFTFDYYYKKTDKLLNRSAVPAYNGGGDVATNIGSIENKGFEANLNFVIIENRNWSYEINMNGSLNRNKVLDIGDEQERLFGGTHVAGAMDPYPFIIMPGHPIGSIYGYKYLGLWQLGDVVEAAQYQSLPGYYRYDDLNGNGEYDAGDYQIIGCASPKFTWGFNNHLSWKNWDLNVLLEGLHGRDIINLTYALATNTIDNALTITSREGKDRWTPDNPNAKFSNLKQTSFTMKTNSDQWIQDGSYMKVRNVSLAYRFPKQMIKYADARLALSVQNLCMFTKYKGYDPEVSSASGSDTDAGLDWYAYPNPRSFTISLSVDF